MSLQFPWLPARWRVQFKLCCVMHSVFHETCPAYLPNIVEPVGAGHTRFRLRSTSTTDFSLPRLRTKFDERSFSHAGPSAWNHLHEDFRAVADPAKFRQQLLRLTFLLELLMFSDFRPSVFNVLSDS